MISIEDRTFLLKLILLILYLDFAICAGCDSNQLLYTEIGCKPIFENGSNSCAVAYDCENVFTRSRDNCYLNGNVYSPKDNISQIDSELSLCVSGCFCNQKTINNKTTTTFACEYDRCTSYFSLLLEKCYYKFDKNLCCETESYCPGDDNATVHECIYDGITYKDGQQFKIKNDYQCVCSPEFNGTANEKSCRKFKCNYELLYMENILNRDAPLYYEEKDGCPINWYQSEYESDMGTVEVNGTISTTSHVCMYGNLRVPIGQQLKIDRLSIRNSESDTHKTICTCDTPPLITCITGKKAVMTDKYNMHIT
ncbi:uncharacterized protein LOC100166564 precursor [Acyrthosiphon pisum]|uniref:ACYPI007423 protein n=1 Tax=Acyrthosiphon pisum TaxID=7029 RepID=C4WTF6_ACYPI|nr:uncharacterized protein LOC100166564 precursor [Acyrthosiphon pisum]BAH71176.1 ACYPI007423 [Acyrthosiphon pisum]|eukprot:NP_001155713.1 uncharacterized protein LOC100166564 precursor [Acyrthosiphon pisum]